MSDYSKLIVVTAQHGEKYIGHLSEEPVGTDAKRYIEHCVEKSLPVQVVNARLFICHVQPQVSQSGQILGVSKFAALFPIDVFSGPMEKIHVMPSSWYFIDEVPSLKNKVDQLMEAAEKNERINQAREAGIHIPGRQS